MAEPTSSPIVPQKVLAVVIAILAVLGILAYAALAGWSILAVVNADDTIPTEPPPVTYFLTGLAGLVGGITATAFGVADPGRGIGRLGSLSRLTTAGATSAQWIGTVYVLIYIVVGIAAAVTWFSHWEIVSETVRNLAVVFFGMVIPIIAGWFATSK